jgi:hypothetical protein
VAGRLKGAPLPLPEKGAPLPLPEKRAPLPLPEKRAPLPLPEKRAPLPLPLPDGSLVVVAGEGKLVGAADGRDVGLHAQANKPVQTRERLGTRVRGPTPWAPHWMGMDNIEAQV